jgi:16S rRNA G527 N7-methylase RsmG
MVVCACGAENVAVLAGRAQKGHSRLIDAAAPRAFRQMESTEP